MSARGRGGKGREEWIKVRINWEREEKKGIIKVLAASGPFAVRDGVVGGGVEKAIIISLDFVPVE